MFFALFFNFFIYVVPDTGMKGQQGSAELPSE